MQGRESLYCASQGLSLPQIHENAVPSEKSHCLLLAAAERDHCLESWHTLQI